MSALHIEISCNTRGHKGAGITKDIVRPSQTTTKTTSKSIAPKKSFEIFQILHSMIYNYI